jgi:CheY-like chemotaxis protein
MKRILIVEDDMVAATAYERLLQAHGFAVEVARDGAEGLERLASSVPDAVVLDLMMPKVNGLEVLKKIRAHETHSQLPVLVLTSACVPALVEMARTAGATQVFDKANDKPLALIGLLHDLLHTTSDSHLVVLTKNGNPDSCLEF